MTLTEVLPAQLSSKHNACHFTPSESTPSAGLLVIDTARTRTEYLLVEFAAVGGRGFRLVKTTHAGDPEAESYDLLCSPAGEPRSCQCKGHIYGRGKPCKHLLAVQAVIENGWLRSEHTNPDADHGPTELDDQDAAPGFCLDTI